VIGLPGRREKARRDSYHPRHLSRDQIEQILIERYTRLTTLAVVSTYTYFGSDIWLEGKIRYHGNEPCIRGSDGRDMNRTASVCL